MKKLFATLFMSLFFVQLTAFDLDTNISYDYFRSLPDGSFNGNTGIFLQGNSGCYWENCVGLQIGGSYGLYNFDGRQNLVFHNPKTLLQQAFFTTGAVFSLYPFNGGIVYDRMFAKHFGIYDLSTTFDQIRFQAGYQMCNEEIGVMGTAHLSTSNKRALGVPVSFRAISQLNLFWTHYFRNHATTTLWAGAPYQNSLYYHGKTAGTFIGGFSFEAPLNSCLTVNGHGCYMKARKINGARQGRNYAANICFGITYALDGGCCPVQMATYLPVANNSNFLVDTNINN
jgi:hypothetical protein